jgi:hypothetical protein
MGLLLRFRLVPSAHIRSGMSLLIEKKKRPLNTAAAMHQNRKPDFPHFEE